jgi:hypothetical protein
MTLESNPNRQEIGRAPVMVLVMGRLHEFRHNR